MPSSLELGQAQAFLTEDRDAAQVFRFILQRSAAPGWMIVKALGQEAAKTEESLNNLRTRGLLEGDGDGLDGFYHSTSLGYALRDVL